ncbi:hypothetical protein AGMMS50262_08770 [Bacteroidia bacterium]|uniref:Uncharacterized protein n=1 Tax=Dysgonomonas termitidis TaxID=1516126 RepID=A0ABV9L3W9_9BACT|nr:hypothetical protein AGMMS50262_08770 [Bacteroidia bacterium]
MSNTNKMDTSAIFEMFETINSKLDKQPNKQVEVDLSAINAITERFENVIDEVKKPTIIEHQHRHTIDIRSNWFFLSWVALAVIVLGSFWAIANQRQTISQYRDNDMKYRYIKMQGQTSKENLYWLEQQFKYGDSIRIIRKHVEKYEELVQEQAERLERVRRNSEEAEKLRENVELLKTK